MRGNSGQLQTKLCLKSSGRYSVISPCGI